MENLELDAESLKKVVRNLDDGLWQMVNNVICTICHELFAEPVTNTCGHSFCSECLKKFLGSVNNVKSACPLCRQPVNRRALNTNLILSKIAAICSEFPAAFKEDVMKLSSNLTDVGKELIDSSRISEISMGRSKEKNKEVVKKANKRGCKPSQKQTKLTDSVISCSVLSRTEENVDLDSVSQIKPKPQTAIFDSPGMEKKLKGVRQIKSNQKVNDWLRDVESNLSVIETENPQTCCAKNEMKGLDGSPMQTKEQNNILTNSTSMIRIDYDKPRLTNEQNESMTTISIAKEDPYEFIPSQRSTIAKAKRASGRGRKRVLPDFEAIHCFSKASIRKPNRFAVEVQVNKEEQDDISCDFNDIGNDNLRKTYKTYSRKSKESKKLEEEKRTETGKEDEDKTISIDQDSLQSDIVSVKKPRVRRRILPLCSDSDDSSVINISKIRKKAKISDSILNRPSPSNSQNSENDDHDDESPSKAPDVPNKSSESPGWSRVSNLKIDFESTNKRNRQCRKTLNISGGELSTSGSKSKNTTDISSDDKKEDVLSDYNDNNENIYIEDLSQSSQLIVGFGSQVDKQEDFKRVVENMEKELDIVLQYQEIDVTEEMNEKTIHKPETPTIDINNKDSTMNDAHKTPSRKTIPFSLLGRIKKKRRTSIEFLKLGRLSPCLNGPRSTVVKLMFHKSLFKNGKKQINVVGIQTDPPQEDSTQPLPITPEKAKNKSRIDPELICLQNTEAEVQTSQSFLQSSTKEVQTHGVELKSIDIQTETTNIAETIESNIPTQIFEDFDTPQNVTEIASNRDHHEEVPIKEDINVNIDSDLQNELNKTWTQAGQTSSKPNQTSKPIPEEEKDCEVIDIVSNNTDMLMELVERNIKLDLERARASSSKITPVAVEAERDHCEESDSDIFIDQTPPKNKSLNGSNEKFNQAKESDESFLILSACDAEIPGAVKVPSERTKEDHKSEFPTKQSFAAAESSNHEKNDENNQNELNWKRDNVKREKELKSKRICIVSSCVLNQENIDKFVARFKVEYSSCPKKDMTHLVVGVHENEDEEMVPYCTPKLLFAIANKKWVVTEAWVKKCLSSDAIVDEEPFESLDPVGGNGCATARLSSDLLLKNIEVLLLGEYEGITKKEFSGLITDCGGAVIRHPSQFSYGGGKLRMILADGSDMQGEESPSRLTERYRTLVMSRDVIIVSVQSYKLVPFTPYLLHSISEEQCLKWGYPRHLVENED